MASLPANLLDPTQHDSAWTEMSPFQVHIPFKWSFPETGQIQTEEEKVIYILKHMLIVFQIAPNWSRRERSNAFNKLSDTNFVNERVTVMKFVRLQIEPFSSYVVTEEIEHRASKKACLTLGAVEPTPKR